MIELSRSHLLALALAEHPTLSAALAAAQAAWSWAAIDDAPREVAVLVEPMPLTCYAVEPAEATPADVPHPDAGVDPAVEAAAPIVPDEAPPPADVVESVETRAPAEDPAPAAPEPDPPAAPPAPVRDVLEETIDAIRELASTGTADVSIEMIADALRLKTSTAATRVQRLVASRRLLQAGAGSGRRYRLPPTKAAPKPPSTPAMPPPAPIRAEETPFVSIETVRRFLQTRDFVITGGPETYKVDGHDRHWGWMVDRANRFREADGKILWIVRG